MKIDFEGNFSNAVLEKGYKYYVKDYVCDISANKDVISATVRGRQNYNTSVTIEDNTFISGYCNCPYIESANCKHIAALLYCIENEEIELNELKKEGITKETELLQIIKQMSKEELENYLSTLLLENEHLYENFRLSFITKFSTPSLKEYKRRIKREINELYDRSGFIDYNDSWNYPHAMYPFIGEARQMSTNQYYELAFDIAILILEEIPDLNIDDSDGVTGSVSSDCIEVISNIIDGASNDQKKNDNILNKIYNYIINEINTGTLYNYGIELQYLLSKFVENKILLDKLEPKLIEIIEPEPVRSDHRVIYYSSTHYINLLISLYEKKGETEKILPLLEEHLDNYEIFLKYIDIKLNQGEYLKVIPLIINYRNKIYHDSNRYSCYKLSETLLNIYFAQNMEPEYKKELYEIFFKYNKYDLEIYKKIKSLYSPSEWKEEFEKIYERLEKSELSDINSHIMEIYIEENMIDSIYDAVKGCKDFYSVSRYEKYIVNKYSNELIDMYIGFCIDLAKQASGRKAYQIIANHINHIKNIPGSAEKLKELLAQFQIEYKSRRAMMEEINKIC